MKVQLLASGCVFTKYHVPNLKLKRIVWRLRGVSQKALGKEKEAGRGMKRDKDETTTTTTSDCKCL